MNIKIIKSAAQARGFYGMPIYKIGDKKPNYYDLFAWSPWGYVVNNEKVTTFGGSLREELFDTIDKKIAYLQGVFEDCSEGMGIIRNENWIQFANSIQKVERCKKWINEVARFMLVGKRIATNENEHLMSVVMGGIKRYEVRYFVPICHRIDIEPELVKFVKNYKFENLD